MGLYETARYKVLDKEGKFEVRAYESYYTAGVEEPNIIETSGFNQIFGYISGDNIKAEKISMTTPVINELQEGSFTTEFVMPSKYASESPPEPVDKKIKIRKNLNRVCASVTFSGMVSEDKIHKYQEELMKWLKQKGLKTTGSFRLARYNPPFTPPIFRRNEILIDLTEEEET